MSKSTAANLTTAKPNIYQVVTDRILASLKSGIIPWQKPWQAPTYTGGSFPRNFRTGKPYRGVNVFLLWSTPYSAPFWPTFKQAQELGGTVRKGEKGTQIVFYKQLNGKAKGPEEQPEETTDEKGNRSPFVLAYYTVFNVEQCDGLKLPEMLPASEPNDVRIDETAKPSFRDGMDGQSYNSPAPPSAALITVRRQTPCTCRHASASSMHRSTTRPSFMNWSTAPDMRLA